jgi:hypothetical protein
VADTAGAEIKKLKIDLLAVKKHGFCRILDNEEKHLTQSKDLIAALRRSIDNIS